MTNSNHIPDKLEEKEYVDALFLGTKRMCEYFDKTIITCLRNQLNVSRKETPFTVTYFRIHLLVKSVLRLNEPGDFQVLASIARTSFELLIDLKILDEDKVSNSADKYHFYRDIMIYNRANRLKEFFTRTKRTPEHTAYNKILEYLDYPGRKDAIENTAMKYWSTKDILKRKHWSAYNNINDRAKLFGDEYEQYYVEFFPLLNLYIHAGSSGLFGFDEDGLMAVCGQALILIQETYIKATRLIIKKFELHKGYPDIYKDIEDLNNTTARIMKNMYFNKLNENTEREIKSAD